MTPDSVAPFTHIKQYASISGDIDCGTETFTNEAGVSVTRAQPQRARGIYSGGGGDLVVVFGNGAKATLTFLPGEWRFADIAKVLQTGSTALVVQIGW